MIWFEQVSEAVLPNNYKEEADLAQLAKYIDREYSYSEVKARPSDGQRHVTITATGLASSS